MKVMNMLVNMVFFQKVTTDNTDDKKINVMQMTDGSKNTQLLKILDIESMTEKLMIISELCFKNKQLEQVFELYS